MSDVPIAVDIDAIGMGVIKNEDRATIVLTDLVVAEGNAGTVNSFVVAPFFAAGVTFGMNVDVVLRIEPAGATPGTDYISPGLTVSVTINGGSSTSAAPLVIPIIGDTTSEPNEKIRVSVVRLENSATGELTPNYNSYLRRKLVGNTLVNTIDNFAELTIEDEEHGTVTLATVAGPVATGTESNTGVINVKATYDGPAISGNIEVKVAAESPGSGRGFAKAGRMNGQVVVGGDYSPGPYTILLPGVPGQSMIVPIRIGEDNEVEGTETFQIFIQSVRAPINSPTAADMHRVNSRVNARIFDNDVVIASVNVDTATVAVTEGTGIIRHDAKVEIDLSAKVPEPTHLFFTLAGVGAAGASIPPTAGLWDIVSVSDHTAVVGVSPTNPALFFAVIPANHDYVVITMVFDSDSALEPDEDALLTLRSLEFARSGADPILGIDARKATSKITILNDD